MTPDRRDSRRESGAALLVAMMMLALMALIGFASMDTVMRDRQMAGNNSVAQNALYAADAGLSNALEVLRTQGQTVPFGGCIPGTVPAGTLPNGTSYGPDSTATGTDQQICMLANAEPCLEDTDPNQVPLFFSVWKIQVEGQAPAGTVARVAATTNLCRAFAGS